MLSNQNSYKKIIISAGKIYQKGLIINKNYKDIFFYKKGFTVIELIVVLLIISIITTLGSPISVIQKIYYKHKTRITINKIHNLISFAKCTAVITNRDITLCPFDFENNKCSNDWHKPITIFYSKDKNNFLNIILKENNLLSKNESIEFKNFNQNNSIIFKKNNNDSINGTITYTNIYYTENIIINRAGRVK